MTYFTGTRHYFQCDHHGCDAEIVSDKSTRLEAMLEAAKKDWSFYMGTQGCPSHSAHDDEPTQVRTA